MCYIWGGKSVKQSKKCINMLNERMVKALNDQIMKEAYSSNLYLAMASWCEVNGMMGCADFMYRHTDEERMHMMKIFRYVNEMDAKAIVPALPQPPADFKSIEDMFNKTYDHEQQVTASINQLVALSNELNDFATHAFMQWFVEEQREEEATFKEILDKIKLIGNGPQSLYYIDMEVEKINSRLGSEAGAE